MRFLVAGEKSQLEFDIVQELKSSNFNDILEYNNEIMDITNKRQVEICVVENEPDAVILCTSNVSEDGIKNVSEMTELIDSKFIYISEDCDFNKEEDVRFNPKHFIVRKSNMLDSEVFSKTIIDILLSENYGTYNINNEGYEKLSEDSKKLTLRN